jgi:hypothetical protein
VDDAERARFADDIANRIKAATAESKPSVLKNAGEAVGLIAGIVALTYLLGALVLLLRLVFDGYRAEQAVAVIGELPRERVVSLGFVEVVASAAIIGIFAALFAATINKPSHHRNTGSLWKPPWLIPLLVAVSVAMAGATIVVFERLEDWRWQIWLNLIAIPFTFVILLAGWRALRLAGGDLEHRASRVVLVGFVFTLVTIPTTLFASAVVRFEPVRLCVVGYDEPRTGRVIALTKDSAVITREEASAQRTIVSFPGDKVTRSDVGDVESLPSCPAEQSSATGSGGAQVVVGARAGRQAGREAGRQAGQHAGRKAGREAGGQAGQHAGRKAGREAGRQAGRNAGRKSGAS